MYTCLYSEPKSIVRIHVHVVSEIFWPPSPGTNIPEILGWIAVVTLFLTNDRFIWMHSYSNLECIYVWLPKAQHINLKCHMNTWFKVLINLCLIWYSLNLYIELAVISFSEKGVYQFWTASNRRRNSLSTNKANRETNISPIVNL